MDRNIKKVVGLFFAELYEIKALLKKEKLGKKEKGYVFALRNGFENVINDIIDEEWWVSKEDEKIVAEILDRYFLDSEELKKLTGFYDIEPELNSKGIDRMKALTIMQYFNSRGSFSQVLKKMDSTNSPQECRTFEID